MVANDDEEDLVAVFPPARALLWQAGLLGEEILEEGDPLVEVSEPLEEEPQDQAPPTQRMHNVNWDWSKRNSRCSR